MSNFFIVSESKEKNTKKDKKSWLQTWKATLYDVSLHHRDLTKILCGEKRTRNSNVPGKGMYILYLIFHTSKI